MKIILILIIVYVNLLQFTNLRKVRVHPQEEFLNVGAIDKNVANYTEYLNIDNLVMEQVDDDIVQVGGYIVWLKSLDRNLPISMQVRSQFYDKSIWNEGLIQMAILDQCKENLNPSRFWYNYSKLWGPEVCPPEKGDIWIIENQILTAMFNLPLSFPLGQWRAYVSIFQGPPGFKKNQVGYGLQFEFEQV